MKLKDKTVVVTGGARGIGKALCNAFAREGAQVVVADILEHEATEAAAEIDGLAVACDVTRESDIQELVNETERVYGSIDLFCSNAGICSGEPDHSASASNDTWQVCWDIHVMAHVYAAYCSAINDQTRRRLFCTNGVGCRITKPDWRRSLFRVKTRSRRVCRITVYHPW